MIPWKPIHRYAGMTSLFDELDEQQQASDAAQARFDVGGGTPEAAPPPLPARTPLGFIDVRSEAASVQGENEPETVSAGEDRPPVEAMAAAEDEKVPFYKREISFGRKKTESDSGAAVVELHEPVDEHEPGDIEASFELHEPAQEEHEHEHEQEEKVPFYKRELSFRRKSEDAAREEDIVDEPEHEAELEFETHDPAESVQPEEAAEPVTVAAQEASHPEPVHESAHEPVQESHAELDDLETLEFDDDATSHADVYADAYGEAETPEYDAEPVTELEPIDEPEATTEAIPAAVSKVPLHKRELSFGRQPAAKKGRGGPRRSGRKIVGLKIGASQLAAAVVQENDGRHELLDLARIPLEPGIVLDGEVRDADALATALRSFFAEQKLPTRDVRIGVASNRIGVRTFEIAGIDDEQRFDNAVRFKAHEVLPIAVSDSVLDYRVLEERVSEAGEAVRRILLVVAPRDQVAPYVEVAQRAGIKLAGIDLEALGLLRAFVEPGQARTAGGTSTVVVAIGHEASTLLVSGGGTCEFTRVFDWGGSTLQEAIAQELEVHPAEAATILRHLSLAGNSRRVEGVDDEAKNRALEAVRLRLTPFARELVSSLQFYQTQPESLGIGEIVITGGTSQLEGLAGALHQMIGVQVRVGDPLERLTLRRGVESGFEQSLGSLAVPIGLAIDDDFARSVDLTPRDVARAQRRRVNLAPVLLPAAAVIPLAALGFLFSQAHGKVSDRHDNLSSLQTQLAALPEPKGPQIDASLQGAEAARASAVAQVLASRTSWDGVFRDLSRVLPENVWLTELKAAVPVPLSVAAVPTTATASSSGSTPATPAVPAAPTGVTISGYTFEQPDVAVLLNRLVALPTLESVQLVSSTQAFVGKKQVVQFTILANLRGAGGGA
jgi:type IV pilus assembly protein PilM